MVRVRVLGPLVVERDGGELTGPALGGARERRLLGVLAEARGQVVPKEVVVERVWDRPPANPGGAVDTAVSLLRRALGPAAGIVETVRPGYRLTCPTDLGDSVSLERQGRREQALALVGGEFLAGEPATDWVDERRRDLAGRHVGLLVAAGREAAGRGDDDTAAAHFSAAVAADRLREDAHRDLMASLARKGRTAEALRAFEHCRRVLREEVGVDPDPETTALYESIVAGRPPRPATTRRQGPPDLPFLGRRVELAQLCAPAAGCVLRAVLGEPGIGKSRLVEEAVAGLPAQATRVTKCFRLVAPVPYTVLSELAPGLVEDAGGQVLQPEAAATRLAAAWSDALGREATTLVIDDLQWADEPSVMALGLVLRRQPPGLTVLATARHGELVPDGAGAQLLDLAARLGVLETITLGPLTAEEMVTGGLRFEDWERTGGHPLFLVERLRGGSEQDLAGLILSRAAQQGPAAAELLRAAAVLDRAPELPDLAGLAGVALDEARAAAAGLEAAGLLAESGGLWRVRHDVVAEVVRGELSPTALEGWHSRALARLQETGAPAAELAHHALGAGDSAAALRHSLDAGDDALTAFANREAIGHYSRALGIVDEQRAGGPDDLRRAVLGHARALIVLGRPDEAATLVGRLPRVSGREEVERLLVEADCGWAAWKPSRAVGPARRALELALELGDEELAGRVHAFICNPYGSLGELARAREHIDAAMEIAARRGQPVPALVLYRLALIHHHTGREEEALSVLDRCREAARAQHDERAAVFERIVRAWSLGALGRYGEALSALDDVSRIGKGEEAAGRSRLPNTRGWLLSDLGLVDMALDADEESLEIARAHGGAAIAEPQIHTLLNLATDHLRLGDPDKARRYLDEAEGLSVDAEYARFRYLKRMHWVRGLLSLEGGDVDGALESADATAGMARRYDSPRYDVRAALLRAAALGRRPDELHAAVTAARAAARDAERHGFAALAEEAHRLAGDLGQSAHHARQADRWRARIVASVDRPLRDRLH